MTADPTSAVRTAQHRPTIDLPNTAPIITRMTTMQTQTQGRGHQ